MDAVLGISITKHTRKAGHRAVDRHRSVASPYNIFCLLAESAFLRTGVPLVPDGSPSPDPPCPLEGISDGRVLSPVNKEADRSPSLAGFPHIVQPFCHPVGPGTLILVIPIKIRKGILCFHAAVLLVGGTVAFILLGSPGRIGRIGHDCIKNPRLESFYQL